MITDLLFGILDATVGSLVRLLPKGTLVGLLPDAAALGGPLEAWDRYIPILGPLRIVTAYVAALTVFVAFKVGVWVWGLMPGKMS